MVRDRLILPSSEDRTGIEQLPTLMTLILPAHSKPIEDLRQELKSAGCAIIGEANELLDSMPMQHGEADEEVELVVVSPRALSFRTFNQSQRDPAGSYKLVRAFAASLGLKTCPAVVGPLLCKAFKNQPWGRQLLIAMEPIKTKRGNTGIFALVHASINFFSMQNCLIAKDYSDDSICEPDDQLLFIREKTTSGPSGTK